MEAIKNTLGLGKTEQQGQEPVSGQQGSGTVAEPYDAGNQEEDPSLGGKAPQQTSATNDFAQPDTTTMSSTTAAAPTTSATPIASGAMADTTASSGKPDISDPPTTTDTATAPAPASEAKAEEPAKAGGIGSSSWFKTALPFGMGKPAAEETPAATTTVPSQQEPTAQAAQEPEKDISELPPNHLPTATPHGQSTDLAAPEAPAGTTTSALPASGTANADVAAISGSDAMAPPGTQEAGSTGPKSAELPGTHSSIASPPADLSNAPLRPAHRGEPHGDNHSSIPTAGGQTVGASAMEERKSSVDARRASLAAVQDSKPSTDLGSVPEKESTAGTTETGKSDEKAGASTEDHHEGEGEGKEKKSHNPLHKLKEKLHKH